MKFQLSVSVTLTVSPCNRTMQWFTKGVFGAFISKRKTDAKKEKQNEKGLDPRSVLSTKTNSLILILHHRTKSVCSKSREQFTDLKRPLCGNHTQSLRYPYHS